MSHFINLFIRFLPISIFFLNYWENIIKYYPIPPLWTTLTNLCSFRIANFWKSFKSTRIKDNDRRRHRTKDCCVCVCVCTPLYADSNWSNPLASSLGIHCGCDRRACLGAQKQSIKLISNFFSKVWQLISLHTHTHTLYHLSIYLEGFYSTTFLFRNILGLFVTLW